MAHCFRSNFRTPPLALGPGPPRSPSFIAAPTPVKRFVLSLLLMFLLAAGGVVWWQRDTLRDSWHLLRSLTVEKDKKPNPRPEEYRTLVEDATRWRKDLAKRYRAAPDRAARQEILAETRDFLETLLPAMMRCWLGTPWDFNGTAECPGDGKIACGYFVATVLRDAGFRIDRYRLAKQPSQKILRTFLPRKAMHLRAGVSYKSFAAEIRKAEPGIYIVGLDTHVGFLVVPKNGAFHFIHSSASAPRCVVEEPQTKATALARSHYRVFGNLTADPEVLRQWLLEKPFPVGKR